MLEIHCSTPLTTQPVNRAIESSLCLHLGLCAQSSENCLKEPPQAWTRRSGETGTRVELGTKSKLPCVAGENLVIHFWRSGNEQLLRLGHGPLAFELRIEGN